MLNKKRIMLVLMVLFLLSPIAQAALLSMSYTAYPPASKFTQGYWENSAGSTGSKTDSQMYFNIIRTVLGDTDELYYVTNDKVDLNDTSYIRIDWARTSTCNGNATIGIGHGKNTNTFTKDKRVTSDFARTNSTINVGDYYDSYYIKVGGDTTTSAFGGYNRIYVYNVTLHNFTLAKPSGAVKSTISSTQAYLKGKVYKNGDTTNATWGFFVYNTSIPNASHNWDNWEKNVSITGNYNYFEQYGITVSGLSPGQYYYYRCWSYDGYNYNLSDNMSFFMTLPNEPSNFKTIQQSATFITLGWTNSSVGNTSNHSVLIHYSTSEPPGGATPDTWGTFGVNESTWNYATISDLLQDTTYYFAAWTYVNNSGSPTIAKFSSSFATTTNYTQGGVYNITVRYENESSIGNLPVNLSIWGQHKFVIHTQYYSGEIIFNDGIDCQTGSIDLNGYFGDNSSGNFTIETNETILWIDFYWNHSNNSLFRCSRSQVVLSGERNITFYIRTDLPVYGTTTYKEVHSNTESVINPANPVTITTSYQLDEIYGVYVYNASIYGGWVQVGDGNYTLGANSVTISADVLDANSTLVKVEYYTYSIVAGTSDISGTLVQYTYTFKDASTRYVDAEELNAYAEIYYYNDSAVKQIIHREFLSANDEVYPMLIYDKKYRIGIGLYSDSSALISLVGLAPTGDTLKPEAIEIPWLTEKEYTFFEVIDLDIGWSSGGSGLYVYYQDILHETGNVSCQIFAYNHTLVYSDNSTSSYYNFTYGDADYNTTYTINITTQHTAWATNQSVEFQIFGKIPPITDITSLNDLLDKIFGHTPFQNTETGEIVTWSYALVGGIAFIIMLSVGYINSYMGMIGTGLWLAASPAFIVGLPASFAIVGIFLVAMAIIFALGAKQ